MLAANSETAAIDHFVSPPEGETEASSGPDDRMKLSYAAEETPSLAAGAFDMVVKLGDSKVNVYRYRDPDTGKTGYFDAEGYRLGQYLLRNPVPDGRRTSGFGNRRHPVLGYSRMHAAVDWAAPVGTPIYAAADGVVTFSGKHGGEGRMTVIDHGHGCETAYSHQSRFADGIKAGVKVRQGEVIGYVGQSGLATGPHLHYAVSVNGRKVDPMKVHFVREGRLSGTALAKFEKAVAADGGNHAAAAGV
ncbi:M23 family metallopeptidase [Martelella lutilitoris]|uniref:M23 family metallopeptidase n=1 Tax=Martelella lutilitoris TaxID=2583532 RepID=A0A5C4JP57_9HYPH|nr:M23 family metallopeptidase [Martelella lutilitoris]TNB47060.1 M23 family metallopeptidase [Martelella lutilitoris]